jgi:signal transduction histidine kinase/integral membrane sensor domain MASE1
VIPPQEYPADEVLRSPTRLPAVRAVSSSWAAALGPLVVAVAYYLGCLLGFVLRFPPATTSILWPPNAILTSALLLAPPRRWWLFLAAALPAHVVVEMHFGLPLPLILALFLTNSIEALIAAGLAHRLSPAPTRFDTLGRAALFLFAVVLVAPIASGFVDAAAVAALRGEPYGAVWRTRLFSNTLSALTVVPVIVSLVQVWPAVLRAGMSSRRAVEAVSLLLLMIVVGGAIFTHPFTLADRPLRTGTQSELVLLLPLLLWAATRFGAAGSSAALLSTAVLAFLAATSHEGTASELEAARDVRVLQSFLLVAGIPLFALGALMEERRAIEQALQARLRFEALLSRLSAAFAHLPTGAMDPAFEGQLRQVGEEKGLQYVSLFRVSSDRRRLEPVSAWSAGGQTSLWPPARGSPAELLEHAQDHEDWRIEDGRGGWTLGVPLETGDTLLGAMLFGGVTDQGAEIGEPEARLHLVAEVFSSALERQRAEEDARRSRDELAHFLRVSTVGELTTSLAHELNQPLTAILANAQAARQLLDSGMDPDEMREILNDIVEEDKRAGEVIRRLRQLLRKGAPEYAPLDLNILVTEVVGLVASDATIRNVAIRLDLASEPARVHGDRVQIQQVLLNMLLNATDAMAELPPDRRLALVTTAIATDEGAVHVAVRDAGSGLSQADPDGVFEPFYTTKPAGMGMGLSIARSIVAAHGGRIWARDNAGAGATFTFSLPLVRRQ